MGRSVPDSTRIINEVEKVEQVVITENNLNMVLLLLGINQVRNALHQEPRVKIFCEWEGRNNKHTPIPVVLLPRKKKKL